MVAISVVMPTYNAAKWVAAAIDAVNAQTFQDIELVVVDDASTDDTVSVLRRKLGEGFTHRWRIIELDANGGPSAARNRGVAAASGEWIQFLDIDDLIPPTKFALQMAVCANAPEDVSAVYAPFRFCYIEQGDVEWEGPLVVPDMEGRAPILCLVGGARPLLNAGLARRSVLTRIGGFDVTLRFWECEELMLRLAEAGRLLQAPAAKPMYLWRLHRGQAYIGANNARYQCAPVSLSWIDLMLKATRGRPLSQLGLSEAERRMILDNSTLWGRLLYAHDRKAFRHYVTTARRLVPDIAPTQPAYASAASRYVGYEAAERLAMIVRKPKTLVKSALERFGLRPQPTLFDLR